MEQPSLGTYQSRHDMPFLDSVGSAGSSRYQPFASQRSFIASDSGYDDLTKESPFFSNGGKMGSDLLDGGYGSRGLDNEYSGYSSHISHHHYDNSEGEDIDNIMLIIAFSYSFVEMNLLETVLLVNNEGQRII